MDWLRLWDLPIFNKCTVIKCTVFLATVSALVIPFASSLEKPQKLKQESISLGNKKISVEIARSSEELSKGLMYRKTLDADSGMLFIFPEERVLSFWMKNTFIPLSIGFFGSDLRLQEVLDMEPSSSVMNLDLPQYRSNKPAKYALEMNKGWFKKNEIKVGSQLKMSKSRN